MKLFLEFHVFSILFFCALSLNTIFDFVANDIENELTKYTLKPFINVKKSTPLTDKKSENKSNDENLISQIVFNQKNENGKKNKNDLEKANKRLPIAYMSSLNNNNNNNIIYIKKELSSNTQPVAIKHNNNNNMNNNANFDMNNKEIKNLKSKVSLLIELNSKISKNLNKKKLASKKQKQIRNKISSFIQKYQTNIDQITKNIDTYKYFTENKISTKENEIHQLYNKTVKNLDVLQNLVSTLHGKIKDLQSKYYSLLKPLNNRKDIVNLKINKKLAVEGTAFISKVVTTKNIHFGKLKLEQKHVTFFNENMKFIIGSEVLCLNELILNLKLVQNIQSKCGKKLEKCEIFSQQNFVDNARKQDEMLKKLKILREDTEKILKKTPSLK